MYIIEVRDKNHEEITNFSVDTLEEAIKAAIGQAEIGKAIQELRTAYIWSTRLAPQWDENYRCTGMGIEKDRVLAIYDGSKYRQCIYWSKEGEKVILNELVPDCFKDRTWFRNKYEHLYYELGFDHWGISILKDWQKEELETTENMDNHRDIIFIKVA